MMLGVVASLMLLLLLLDRLPAGNRALRRVRVEVEEKHRLTSVVPAADESESTMFLDPLSAGYIICEYFYSFGAKLCRQNRCLS